MKSDGCVLIAQRVDLFPPWRNWSKWIADGYAYARAAVAALDGATNAPDVLSVGTIMTVDCQCSPSKGKPACEATAASRAVAIAKRIKDEDTSHLCWKTGLHFISTSLRMTAD